MCEFLTKKNFELAFYRLSTAKRDYYKELYFNDLKNFGLDLNTNIEILIELIKQNIYGPYKASKIYLPKNSGLLRKITVINFIDLIVYQAILNIIAKKFYDDISIFYNYITFSNLLVENLDSSKFFYREWSKSWNAFRKKIKQYLNEGYSYVGEFDIASYYDTIDHFLLMEILKSKEDNNEWVDMLNILERQLIEWSNDSDRIDLKIHHGIPQGPLGSALLGEIYLIYLDIHLKDRLDSEGNVKYVRYVDDIRIFAKDRKTVEEYLRYVELLVNDLGLIPQYDKLSIKNVEKSEIDNYIKSQFDKLSWIDKYFRERGRLKSKHNKKLVKLLKDTIDKQDFDKTIIKFSLYKIDKNEQIKDMLMNNYDKMLVNFDGICFYLAKYFSHDNKVKSFIEKLLNRDIFDDYIISTLLKYFIKHIKFDINTYNTLQKNRSWYVNYFMIDWLEYYKKLGLIMTEEKRNFYSANIYLQKKILSYQVLFENDIDVKRELIIEMMKSDIPIIALEGLKLYYQFFGFEELRIKKDVRLNKFVSANLKEESDKSVNYTSNFFETKYGIENARYLFNTEVMSKKDLDNLNRLLFYADKIEDIDYSAWLSYINSFNHNLVISLLEKENINVENKKEYDNCLNLGNYFASTFPVAYKNFSKINKRRNILPPNHPYENEKEYAKPLTKSEKGYFEDLEVKAIKEISNKYYTLYFSRKEGQAYDDEVAYTLND
ncbi:Reverse transcriptase (RNA-dependent DNA polymerase) [Thermoanaerobacter thermohydrosulfuricus]|uniref:Reverse transcriptase (RNA-dependent DNA polymerase) n=1 Tax=Thermoanaerobacter thermohydrosulfuricus TaxID=1516 RepID=A0A1G7P0G6_THETY|nr:reverse transcriptase domain-containing protein [Thermoanaerobacter thermohydrosulfuricus]SDF79785.1 Reverse transcriptase (RNA-dependent DNA polymerase) [Thermoanaerobacter thermohydrosulfuricus]